MHLSLVLVKYNELVEVLVKCRSECFSAHSRPGKAVK